MDAIKYINEANGNNEGNAITRTNVTGHPTVLDRNNETNMVALSGRLDTLFDEIRYYTNDT